MPPENPARMTSAKVKTFLEPLRAKVEAEKECRALARRKYALLDELKALRERERELFPVAKLQVIQLARIHGIHKSAAYRIKRRLNSGKIT